MKTKQVNHQPSTSIYSISFLMAMSRPARGDALFFRLKYSFFFQRFQHISSQEGEPTQLSSDTGHAETSKWKMLDSVKLGIRRSMISRDSYKVVKDLQTAGFEAYLVGGCVRDLLLNKIPKDFDVITTAKLAMVKRKFRRAIIVGQFPVCRVPLMDSVVEVTSFETIDKKQPARKRHSVSPIPAGCDRNDIARWDNCMRRDFTINSLLYDPFRNKIFDYTNAMMDLRSMKLRTIIPAILSFKEDKARILRGLRLAARLNLSLSKETEAAIHKLSSSVAEISKARLDLEINYMLSYGAAEPSILLLKRFKLLEIFLPFQAAYLSEQRDNLPDRRSLMLMKLFFNLDQLIACDRPCHGSLWVALLSFHLALFNNPQPAEVILTFASLLNHGEWDKSIKFAREHAPAAQNYVPEISVSCDSSSDGEISERVTQLAVQAINSVNIFTKMDSLSKAMARFPGSPNSGLILISQKMGQRAAAVFKLLAKDATSSKPTKRYLGIDYGRLREGDIDETRFVLGEIIIDTLGCGPIVERGIREEKTYHMKEHGAQKLAKVGEQFRYKPTDPTKGDSVGKHGNKGNRSPSKLFSKDADEVKNDGIMTHRNAGDENSEEQICRHKPTDPTKCDSMGKHGNKRSRSPPKLFSKDADEAKKLRNDSIMMDLRLKGEAGDKNTEKQIWLHKPTNPTKGDSMGKHGNKRSRSLSQLFSEEADEAKKVGNDGIMTDVRLRRNVGGENFDLQSCSLASDKMKKDKHVEAEIQRTVPLLSSVFK